MTFAEGSTYTGTGTIAVEKEPSVSLEDVVPGLDLSNLYVRQDGDYWFYLGTDGAMVRNAWIDNQYYVGADGVWIQ